MRKVLLIALVALCASFPGEVCANLSSPNFSVVSTSPNLDEATVERVLEAVSCETGVCIHELRSQYADGTLVIEKSEDGNYAVSQADGGLGTIVILDGI